MIVTGTSQITRGDVQRRLPAVYRRIHCTAELTWMTGTDIRLYFKNFLLRFVPNLPLCHWEHWEEQFVGGPILSPPRRVSIDMLKQFFMSRITDASVRGMGEFVSDAFQVFEQYYDQFFELICESDSLAAFLEAYAPVDHEETDESVMFRRRTVPSVGIGGDTPLL